MQSFSDDERHHDHDIYTTALATTLAETVLSLSTFRQQSHSTAYDFGSMTWRERHFTLRLLQQLH